MWGIAQVGTGALSDRTGRRPLIVSGMFLQAVGLGIFATATGIGAWSFAAIILGIGTAAAYPTLVAQVSDLVTPHDRARGWACTGCGGTLAMWPGDCLPGRWLICWASDRRSP